MPEGHLVAPYVDAKMVTGSISRGILKVDLSIESRRHFRIRTLDINGSILSVPVRDSHPLASSLYDRETQEQEGGRHHSMELKVPMSTLRNHIVVELVSVPTQKSRASPW